MSDAQQARDADKPAALVRVTFEFDTRENLIQVAAQLLPLLIEQAQKVAEKAGAKR